jgi:UDP-glucose:(heptosyl)LPS alpha-1,3-glucosyltransferase
MKIALINKVFSLSHGGGERYAVNLTRALCAAGHETHLFGVLVEDVPPEARVHFVEMPNYLTSYKILAFSSRVRTMIQAESFDIVYSLTQHYPVDLFRMGGGVYKHWMSLRYPNPLSRLLSYLLNPVHLAHLYLESKIYGTENYQRIIVNSKLCKEHAKRYYQVPDDRISVVYTGVDRSRFNPQVQTLYRTAVRQKLHLTQDDIAILFVSNNWKRKGMETILRGVHRLGKKGDAYKIIGVGKSRKTPFVRLAKKLGLSSQVLFYEAIQEIQTYYGGADIFVLPTLYDPFSNVCLEAMACGLPVITSESNGASEMITPGQTGFILNDSTDDQSLSVYLEALLDDSARKTIGGQAGLAVERLTVEHNLAETLEVFEQVRRNKVLNEF